MTILITQESDYILKKINKIYKYKKVRSKCVKHVHEIELIVCDNISINTYFTIDSFSNLYLIAR